MLGEDGDLGLVGCVIVGSEDLAAGSEGFDGSCGRLHQHLQGQGGVYDLGMHMGETAGGKSKGVEVTVGRGEGSRCGYREEIHGGHGVVFELRVPRKHRIGANGVVFLIGKDIMVEIKDGRVATVWAVTVERAEGYDGWCICVMGEVGPELLAMVGDGELDQSVVVTWHAFFGSYRRGSSGGGVKLMGRGRARARGFERCSFLGEHVLAVDVGWSES
jgi:hypothetical protein